ncbi:helix-turn-helix domain-containing protein [Caballeronia sp. LZ001]|uniref:helix-turn-helix domain-containing protein n=1 Tax=Caballeronia sp. LZ001 TaxID=3038553 RepID=UPI0038D46F3C
MASCSATGSESPPLHFRDWAHDHCAAASEPVASVAYQVGYDNVSVFIAVFRRTFGITPGRYFAAELASLGATLESPSLRGAWTKAPP